ncbi:hypothetical protein HY095_03305 [Candidatus Micrarchaeota archaeon]|nr:hypothetical protein [Candidatus Micrarchaeota archaeon]
MADFSSLFLIILALLAFQSNLPVIGAGLVLVTLFTAKNKFLMLAGGIGAVISILLYLGLLADITSWVVLGGLFAIFIILATRDEGAGMGPSGMYPPGAGY